MADYQGYLLLHDGDRADALYFELENGLLRYFTQFNGKILGQLSLTRHRVVLKLLGGPIPNRFALELRPVHSVHDRHRPHALQPKMLTLSAANSLSRRQWIEALSLWRRQFWKDPILIQNTPNELTALEEIMLKNNLKSTRLQKGKTEGKERVSSFSTFKRGSRVSDSAQAPLQFLHESKGSFSRFIMSDIRTPAALAA